MRRLLRLQLKQNYEGDDDATNADSAASMCRCRADWAQRVKTAVVGLAILGRSDCSVQDYVAVVQDR